MRTEQQTLADIAQGIQDICEQITENAALAQESADISETLSQQSKVLRALTADFKLK